MIDVMNAAKYIANKYNNMYQDVISEMKLHKLLYFAQRESLVRYDKPLFDANFQGWRFGPVIPQIRASYSTIISSEPLFVRRTDKDILNYILCVYGAKDAWSLSRLTHGEYSWYKSRIGIGEFENSSRLISIEDIRVDANRIRRRREMLNG